ncbi:MAG: pirin family protein [Bryobacteraceae bacterium]|nr:pirin family protein [Solibacteraceae bacterium]MCL4844483.1 pirin family protein [Bryobacteraceae bacterium]MCO5351226.1 pirin family protein [Bryobacteraceae bacterium]
MIKVRPAATRGNTRISWLNARHSFSFNRYYDPEYMGFRSLRVLNDDIVAPGGKFGMHPHENMEILTWILSGSVAHEDSTGGRGLIRPGDVQRMSAGTGVFHSEANGSDTEPVRLLQIWLTPEKDGLPPSYEDKHFPEAERRNALRLIASPTAENGSTIIHQDARVYATLLDEGAQVDLPLAEGRHAWVQVATGSVTVNGVTLNEGDGAAISGESALAVQAAAPAEVLLFDLA